MKRPKWNNPRFWDYFFIFLASMFVWFFGELIFDRPTTFIAGIMWQFAVLWGYWVFLKERNEQDWLKHKYSSKITRLQKDQEHVLKQSLKDTEHLRK